MFNHGRVHPWSTIITHGQLWSTVGIVNYGRPWSWLTMVDHGHGHQKSYVKMRNKKSIIANDNQP